jgi:uncharacterized protein involved in outer membrane biogenesis
MATIKSLTIVKQRSWLQRALLIAAWIAGVLAILLVVAYPVVTSSGFIKRVILPRVSAAIHADVTVTDISVHPFSKITVRGLKVQAKGQEPVVTAPEIRASYSLWSILRGNLRVFEIALVSPTVSLDENPDGSSNLDALLQASEKKPSESKPPHPGKSSKPPQIDLRNLTLSNATIRKIKNYPGNRRDSLELANVNVTLATWKNGQSGTLQLGAFIQMENNPPTGKAGHLQATLNGNFNFTLSADLKPAPVTGQTRLEVSRADGVFGDFSGFSAVLDCDVTPAEIKKASLLFQRGGTPLGELVVSGPLDMEKMEGRLKVELRGIDRRLLNLAGDADGIDFGTTTISSTNEIELTKAGSVIGATGRFDAGHVQLTRAGQTTPTLDFSANYDVTVDGPAQTALFRGLNVAGTQNGNPLLSAHLSRPMNLAWGNGASEAGDSAFDLAVTNLSLADWKPFLGNAAAAGHVDLTLKLSSQQGGRQLGLNLDSQIRNLVAGSDGSQMILSFAVNGNASVQYDPKGSSAIKASMQVANLVVNDPQRQLPATPLEARLEIDTAVKKQSADIRQLQITLTPTKRGQNQVRLQGQVDYSQPNAVRGNLKLTADSLDLTSYYDLFAGGPKGGNKPAAASPSGASATDASQEPPVKNFPLKNFTVAADIGRFYLREIEITHWQTTVTVDGGHVTVKPFQLALNGAPVNATVDLNLGVPGYRYDVAFGADRVPVAPLVNTFVPERKGQMGGTLTANAQVKGAGITGAGLQRNLTGQFAGGVTNLNLSVMNAHSPILKTLINVIVAIPQLLSSPESAIASLLGQATGQGGGLMDELKKSPIQVINAQGKAGGGRIDLSSASVQSTAFKADAQGGIALAQVLTNSTINIPVAVSVNRSIGKQLNLASANTAASATYVPLPQFLTMKGTIGVPKADINKVALGGMAVQSLGGGVINTATNGPSQVGNLLKLLKKPK